jgi:hypothetical protein
MTSPSLIFSIRGVPSPLVAWRDVALNTAIGLTSTSIDHELEAAMREAQRRLAMTAWRKLFTLAVNETCVEDKYFMLLKRADEMERADLITSEEWRKLVQQAGTSLASTAECMGGAG